MLHLPWCVLPCPALPALVFQAANYEVNDVQWCPTNSTVFGSATSAGRLEVRGIRF